MTQVTGGGSVAEGARSAEPGVAAVVINHDGGDQVVRCVESLLRQDHPLAEVVVVDNGSVDGSPARLRSLFPEVRLIELPENRGASTARNIGLRAVAAELVLLVDDDLYPAPDCVRLLLAARRETGAALAGARIVLYPERDVVHADGADTHFVGMMRMRHRYAPLEGLPVDRTEVGLCMIGCCLADRAALLEAGGFDDEFFFYFEDVECALRMRALGHRIVCEPAAVAYHEMGRGTPGLSFRPGDTSYPARRFHLTARNRVRTILIHYRLRTILVLLPALALYEAAGLAVALARGWGREWLRAWTWQVAQAPDLWRRRRAMQRARRLADRELLVGGPLPFAPGFLRRPWERAAALALSGSMDAYWRLARRWIG